MTNEIFMQICSIHADVNDVIKIINVEFWQFLTIIIYIHQGYVYGTFN